MDWNALVNGLVVVVVPALVAAIKAGAAKYLVQLPRVVVWALPLVLGGLISWITQLIPAIPSTSINGILLGAAAMVLRELVSTVKEHGVNG